MKRGDKVEWVELDTIINGEWVYKTRGGAKIMGIIDGYAMLRFKGCPPFVKYIKDLTVIPSPTPKRPS